MIQVFNGSSAAFVNSMREYLIVALQEGHASAQAKRLLQHEADKASVQMSNASAAWVRPRLYEASQDGITQLGFGGVNTSLLERLTVETTRDLLSASEGPQRLLKSSLREGQAIMRVKGLEPVRLDSHINESLARGVLAQEGAADLQKRLMADLQLDRGGVIELDNGQIWDAEAYTDLVARTRPMEAMNQSKLSAIDGGGYEYIETSEHEGVKDEACLFCQGKVWALREDNPLGIPVLPAEFGYPPWHPNCAHTFGVWIPKYRSQDQIDAALAQHEDQPAD